MDAVLVEAGHPHMPTVSPCSAEQAQDPRAEPAGSMGLPYASHTLGSGRVAEAEEQWRRITAGIQGLKPSDNSHQVGLHLTMGISPNVCGVVAVINDDATHDVCNMNGGRIEMRVTTRDAWCRQRRHHRHWTLQTAAPPFVARQPVGPSSPAGTAAHVRAA